jgi:hypothetical protein
MSALDLTELYGAVVEPPGPGSARHAFIEAPNDNSVVPKIAAVIRALERRAPADVRDRIYNCHSAQELLNEGLSADQELRLFESGWSCGQPTYVREPLILLDTSAALIRIWIRCPADPTIPS